MDSSASIPRKSRLTRLGVPLILVFGIAFSISCYEFVRHDELARLNADFEHSAADRQALIEEGLRGYEECIYNLRSLFANSDAVTPSEFDSAARDILSRRSDIEAIEWVPQVDASDRAKVEAFARADISPTFAINDHTADGRIVPSPARAVYYPILYVYPAGPNAQALGYDLSHAANRPGFLDEIKSSQLVLSDKVRLVQSGPGASDFSLIMTCPVYRPDARGQPDLLGCVQILFRLEDMIGQSWHNYSGNAMDTFIEDLSIAPPADRFLFRHRSSYIAGQSPTPSAGPREELDLHIAGRTWRCTYSVPSGWLDRQISYAPLLVLLGGLTLTALLSAYVRKVGRETGLVADQVRERTAELRESRRQLESLLGQLPGMAYRFSNDDRSSALYISRGCAALTGHAPDDLVSRRIRYDDLVFPDDRNRGQAAIAASLADHRAYEVEYRLRHKDGRMKWVLDRGRGVYDPDGRLLFIEGLAIDVTRAKQSEAEKLAIERKLLESQKLESLGVLAGGIAHDFNNLLTGILGNASLLGLDLPAGSPLLRNVNQIESAAQRAADLCQQMLAYAGKGQFIIRPVNLEDLIRDTLPLLKHSISKRATLHLDFTPALPAVEADITQIRQIIMNLVVNASDALGDHDGVITLSTGLISPDDPRLNDAVLVPEPPPCGLVFLRVADTGSGMTAETLQKIFEPFFTTKFTGRGLGLSAVLGIVRSHRGGLMVSSRPGQGTDFTLILPASGTTPEHNPSREPALRSRALKGTTLVIDDEETVCSVASGMFASLGMQSIAVRDGPEGIDLFRARRAEITLVLLDLTLPRPDGEETLRALRELSADIPIIVTSGYNRTTLAGPFVSDPTIGFLQKPFTLTALAEQIDRLMA